MTRLAFNLPSRKHAYLCVVLWITTHYTSCRMPVQPQCSVKITCWFRTKWCICEVSQCLAGQRMLSRGTCRDSNRVRSRWIYVAAAAVGESRERSIPRLRGNKVVFLFHTHREAGIASSLSFLSGAEKNLLCTACSTTVEKSKLNEDVYMILMLNNHVKHHRSMRLSSSSYLCLHGLSCHDAILLPFFLCCTEFCSQFT